MRFLLAAAFTLFWIAPIAHAHVFLEPDVGFEMGPATQDFKYSNAPENTSSNSRNGSTYGAALGYRHNLVYGDVQYEKGMGGHITDISGVLGANLSIKIRVWAGYIFSAKDEISSGSGFKVGIGTAISHVFRLNGEYEVRNYDKYTGVQASTLTYSGTQNSFKVTLSLPLQLF